MALQGLSRCNYILQIYLQVLSTFRTCRKPANFTNETLYFVITPIVNKPKNWLIVGNRKKRYFLAPIAFLRLQQTLFSYTGHKFPRASISKTLPLLSPLQFTFRFALNESTSNSL